MYDVAGNVYYIMCTIIYCEFGNIDVIGEKILNKIHDHSRTHQPFLSTKNLFFFLIVIDRNNS